MSLAKTPDSTVSTSRRTLGAGLFAVIAGSTITSGIAAGMATSVGGHVSADPDAGLIALCTTAKILDDRSSAMMDATDNMLPSDPRWSPLVDEARCLFAECRKGMNHAAEMPAVTLDGLQAKASLALREMGATDFEACPLVFSVLSQLAEGDVA